jgi:hypothetical protein
MIIIIINASPSTVLYEDTPYLMLKKATAGKRKNLSFRPTDGILVVTQT